MTRMRRIAMRRPVMFSTPFALGLLSTVLIVVGTDVRADEISLKPDAVPKGGSIRLVGTILAESPAAVRIQTTAGTTDVPLGQIDSITYTGQPAGLSQGRIRDRAGDPIGALELYGKAVAEVGSATTPVAAAARFGQASAQARLAESDPGARAQAFKMLDSFVTTFPSSRQLGPALEAIVRLSIAADDVPRAEAAATRMASIPSLADRAAMLQARVMVKKGDTDAALKKLEPLVAAAKKGTPGAVELGLAQAETLSAAGRASEAEAAARAVIAACPPEQADVQALAHNTLGDCLRASGKLKDALLAYLKTDILYDEDREQHARALSRIAQLWRQLGQPERADEAAARLRETYPMSPFTLAIDKPGA
jgi:predicted Zn-dependent protease